VFSTTIFIQVLVQSNDSELPCLCVLWVSILPQISLMKCFRTNAQLQLNYHYQTLTYHIHRRGTKMDNPEKLATHGHKMMKRQIEQSFYAEIVTDITTRNLERRQHKK